MPAFFNLGVEDVELERRWQNRKINAGTSESGVSGAMDGGAALSETRMVSLSGALLPVPATSDFTPRPSFVEQRRHL